MDNAYAGVIGVVVGAGGSAGFAALKELWFQSKKNQKDIEYSSIQIACMLEKFMAGCIEVIYDNGLHEGQYDERDCCYPPIPGPKFELELLQVEWKSFPSSLMYDILYFPIEIEAANSKISSVFENDCPPDYNEGFEERHYQYALLGMKAFNIASKLREIAKLPEHEMGDWNPIQFMKEKKLEIENERIARANQVSRILTH